MIWSDTRRRRLALATAALAVVGIALSLILSAFQDNVSLYYTPSDIAAGKVAPGVRLRVGGIVEAGSLQRKPGSLDVRFSITDTARSIAVTYRGITPDLFREGKGVVAQGTIRDGVMHAQEILAKHDENYMPPPAQDAIDKARSPQSSGRP